MMKNYYDQSMRALQLAGMSKRTQQCYTRSVRMLVDFYNKTPDQLTEVQLQDYFLHRKNKDKMHLNILFLKAVPPKQHLFVCYQK